MAAVKYWFHTAISPRVLLILACSGAVEALAGGGDSPVGEDPRISEARQIYLAESREQLAERLREMAVYSAAFTQDVYGSRGEILERSEGRVKLQRPNFKWVVDDPYPQVIVIQDDQLQVYDPDLEQLTLRPLDEALADTPVSLLTRDDVILGDRFRVARIADEDGQTFVIEPASEETLYREIRLHFNAAGLSGLDILDHLGQRTQIRFAPDPAVSVIESSEFVLEVPPGTDVIGG
jgi:outer membrane lipoprotein carrier protein